MSKTWAVVGLSVVMLSASQNALAVFRCDGYLIDAGQRFYEVSGKCGNPQGSERHTVWRLQTTYQPVCHVVMEPSPPVMEHRSNPGKGAVVTVIPQPVQRQVCTTYPISYSIPVEEEIWYYEDGSAPKALHFENGQLIWIETLWRLQQ